MTTSSFSTLASATARAMAAVRLQHCPAPDFRPASAVRGVMPCTRCQGRYSSVEGNLQAIHPIIEARRVELRHGTLALVRATFQRFKALPKPAGRSWWEVLSVPQDADRQTINAAWRRLSSQHHPTPTRAARPSAWPRSTPRATPR